MTVAKLAYFGLALGERSILAPTSRAPSVFDSEEALDEIQSPHLSPGCLQGVRITAEVPAAFRSPWIKQEAGDFPGQSLGFKHVNEARKFCFRH